MAKPVNLLPFIDWARGECAAAGTKLILDPKESTHNGCLGYFDEIVKVLHVATGDPAWPMTLAHELAHQRQLIEKFPLWPAADTEMFNSWLSGKVRMQNRKLTALTRAIQRMELNAERRAVVTIKKWHLTDDIDAYIKSANFVVWKYEVARQARSWPVYGEARDAIVESMPDRMITLRVLAKPPAIMFDARIQ